MLFSWKMDQINYFVLKYWRRIEEEEIFPNFELLPCFNIDVQPELVNNNFNDEKESLISHWRNANDNSSNKKTKSDLSVWIHWQPSTGKNDFNRFKKNNDTPTWTDFHLFLQKKLTKKCLQDQTQFNWMVHFINKLRDEEVFACMCTRIRKRRENGVTCTPNSQSQSRMNEPVF